VGALGLVTPSTGRLPLLLVGSIIWSVIDAIMIFNGSVPDSDGRKLR
jgi:hypothetical protein